MITAQAAAESLNSYKSFKEQLLPNIKKGNVTMLYPMPPFGIPDSTSAAIGVAKRSKRSKTSFDQNVSRQTSSSAQGIVSQQNRKRDGSSQRRYKKTTKSALSIKSGDCTPFVSIDQNRPMPDTISTQTNQKEDNGVFLPVKKQQIKVKLELPLTEVESSNFNNNNSLLTTVQDMLEDTRRVKNNPVGVCQTQHESLKQLQPCEKSIVSKAGSTMQFRNNQLSVCDVAPCVLPQTFHQGYTVGNSMNSQQTKMLLQETIQDLGVMSIYDQSDNKSQTQTNNAEIQLREENMSLRMEILKLKKALFMKTNSVSSTVANGKSTVPPSDQLTNFAESQSQLQRNHIEPRDEENPITRDTSARMTPLARVVIDDICEEGVSSYSHEDLPIFRGHGAKPQPTILNFNPHQISRQDQVTFNQSSISGCCQEVQATMDRVPSNQNLDDLEQFLRQHGQGINQSSLGKNRNQPRDFIVSEDKRGQTTSVIEQKRHYEQEIEVLKRDLELIEQEEFRIKQRLSEQSSLLLESIRQDRGIFQQALTRASHEQKSTPSVNGQINNAFDSFIEKRSFNNQPQFHQITNSNDRASFLCISDDCLPIVSINHHNQSPNTHHWQPPSFSNSQIQSLAVSPTHCHITLPQHPHQNPLSYNNQKPADTTFQEQNMVQQKPRGRRSRYNQRNQNYNQLGSQNVSQQSCDEGEAQISAKLEPNKWLNGGDSSRLNTDMIDQMFEDPRIQSQFQCLDTVNSDQQHNHQPTVSLLLSINSPKDNNLMHFNEQFNEPKYNDQSLNNSYFNKNSTNSTQAHHNLNSIKQSLKGVLNCYEQSIQKNTQPVQRRHFIGDGTESKFSPKKEQGIPRLSTIKEDSPEFGAFTENSDIINHSSILRQQQIMLKDSQSSCYNPIDQKSQDSHHIQSSSQQQEQYPYRINSAATILKKSKVANYVKAVPSKSPLRQKPQTHQVLQSANQFQNLQKKKTANFIKQALASKNNNLSRSSSPYSVNNNNHALNKSSVSNIVNQAYMDIIKRRQREGVYDMSYVNSCSGTLKKQQPVTYAGIAQLQKKVLLQNKSNNLKTTHKVSVGNKNQKSKENIKFLSNVAKKQEGSRNGQNTNMNQSTSVISSHSYISGTPLSNNNQARVLSRTPHRSHTPNRSQSSKERSLVTTRPLIPTTQLQCIEEQYDTLWSRQVSQKRINLIKKKEETAIKRYQEKVEKIESIKRRKEQEKEERKNKSKSPSNYHMTTTMSEFEQTPYNGLSKIVAYDKGFNSAQPFSMLQSASMRSPKLPSTPKDFNMKQGQHYMYDLGHHFLPSSSSQTPASGLTTNLMTKQNSPGRKNHHRSSRTPEVVIENSTPKTINQNWDQQELISGRGGYVRDNILSSAGTTAVVTANGGLQFENNIHTLRQKFVCYQQPESKTLQTVNHSRSNSGNKISTDKRFIKHKKQSSLSNPPMKTTDLTVNLNKGAFLGNFIQKPGNVTKVQAQPIGFKHNTVNDRGDLMRQFLSHHREPEFGQNHNLSSRSLLQLHPVKYDVRGQPKMPLPPINVNCNTSRQQLYSIVEDF